MQVPYLMDLASQRNVAGMTSRTVALGPFGEIVRENLAARRAELDLTALEVANRTSDAPRPLGRSAVSEAERGARRIDVDDLVVLAIALETSPTELLTPPFPGVAVELGQNDLTILPGQVKQWLTHGGDVQAVSYATDGPEAELAKVNSELSNLDKINAERNVLISILFGKVDQANEASDLDQVQKMLRDEIDQSKSDGRRREIVELRRIELESILKKGRSDGHDQVL